ncbi:MAG: hypothetical protein WHT46_01715, partial [Candidatus Geothermincolales bacterium]
MVLKAGKGLGCLTSILVLLLVVQLPLGLFLNATPTRAESRDVRNWNIMGLDIRDYSSEFKAKVPASERKLVRHHKVVIRWESVNPRQGTWNFSYYDNEIRSILADGSSSILLLLQGPVPSWARDPAYGEFSDKAPPRDLSWWREFCSKVAGRYGPVVDFYEIWNEVGFDRDGEALRTFNVCHFGGQAETDYLPLLQLAFEAIKEVDPTALVICGDMITTNNPDPNVGTGLYALLFDEVGRPGQDISLKVESSGDIVAERPMYFNYMGSWDGGHDVVGALQPSNQWYFAEGCTRSTFDMWLCLQNPNARSIQVTATYMFGPGQGANVVKTYTLSPTSRFTIKVDDEVGDEKDVSVKLTSPDLFIAERPMYFHYNWKWTGGHVVVGATAPSREWYFAEGCTRPGFETWLTLQNPNDMPVNVKLRYLCGDGYNAEKRIQIPSKTRYTVAVHEDREGIGVHNNQRGDVSIQVISEDGEIVAERPMYFNYGGAWNGGHCVMGTVGKATQWYFAEGCTRSTFDMWLCLQNPNARSIQVTATYMFGPGQGANVVKTYTLSPTSRFTIKVDDEVGDEKDVSVKLTSPDLFIAERPMYFHYNWKWTGGHVVVGATAPSREWYFAEGCTRPGFETWLTLQNPNDMPVNVKLRYLCGDGYNAEKRIQIPSKTRYTVAVHEDREGIGVHNNQRGDVSIQVISEDGEIVAERPMYFNYGGAWNGGHCVMGTVGKATQWYFAEGCTRSTFDMWLCLQNPNAR